MTPMEEALDALTDAMLYHQHRCVKDQPHDHALLRKLQSAVSRLAAEPIPDPHSNCWPGAPCSTGCTGGVAMTASEIRPATPATDEELAVVRPLGYRCIGCVLGTPPETHGSACIFAMEPKLLARIQADRAERESNNLAFVEMNAVFEAVMRAIRGEALSEFDESHGAVHDALALRERIRQLEAEVEDWRNREASACPEDFGFEEVIAALRAVAQERDRKIAELEQERDDDTALIRRLNATVAAQAKEIGRLREVLGEILDVLRIHAPGTPLNNHAFDSLGVRARAALKPESPVR